MKKRTLFLFIIGLGMMSPSFGQNYISGVVSLHGDNAASGTTTVASGASLLFNRNKLYEQGGFINKGDSTAISADTGMLVLNGSGAQTITGRFKLGALQLANSSGATINNNEPVTMVTVLDSVNFGSVNGAVLNAGDGLMTLRSNNTKTARIADLTNKEANSNNQITGKIIVERYVRSRRAWHLLGPPTTGDSTNDQTIQTAWQEGARAPRGQIVNPNPGYGTVITRPGSDPATATGYDDGVAGTASYSLRMYFSDGSYTSPPNTDLTHFSPHAAYFLFLRGDRSVSPASQASSTTPSTFTTLRSKGALHNGNVVNVVTKAGGEYAGVSNPYACTVDFSQLVRNNVMNGFYTWDPSINQYGGWAYIDGDDNFNATPVAPGGVYTNSATNALIQSGQAILIKPTAASGSITFTEKSKNLTSRADAFRIVSPPALTVSLFSQDNNHTFLDGTTVKFDPSFSADVLPDEDVTKPVNTNENLSFYASGQNLLIAKNPPPEPGDTLPLRLWRTVARKYSFSIDSKDMDGSPQAFLWDDYTKSSTAIQPGSATDYNFEIAGDSASKAIGRFAIVFGAKALPVSLSQIKATWTGTVVNVQWTVPDETGLTSYEIERSADGSSFTKIGAVAVHNGSASGNYSFADEQPGGGDNYYRIKMIRQTGGFIYSSIVSVSVPAGKDLIAVYQNPVTNGLIKLWFKNEPAGKYQVQVYSTDGKRVFSKDISHAGGTTVHTLPAGVVAQGLYHAVIHKEGNVIADLPMMIE